MALGDGANGNSRTGSGGDSLSQITAEQKLQIFELQRSGMPTAIISYVMKVSSLDIKDLGPASSHRIEMPKDNTWSETVQEILASLAR